MVLHLNVVGETVANELPELFPELSWVSWGAEEKEGSKKLLEACTGLHLGHILKACNPFPIIFKETMYNTGIAEGRTKNTSYCTEILE